MVPVFADMVSITNLPILGTKYLVARYLYHVLEPSAW
jgi:hypothetical protein